MRLPFHFATLGHAHLLQLYSPLIDLDARAPDTEESILHVGIRESWPEVVKFAAARPTLLNRGDYKGITAWDLIGSLPDNNMRQLMSSLIREAGGMELDPEDRKGKKRRLEPEIEDPQRKWAKVPGSVPLPFDFPFLLAEFFFIFSLADAQEKIKKEFPSLFSEHIFGQPPISLNEERFTNFQKALGKLKPPQAADLQKMMRYLQSVMGISREWIAADFPAVFSLHSALFS